MVGHHGEPDREPRRTRRGWPRSGRAEYEALKSPHGPRTLGSPTRSSSRTAIWRTSVSARSTTRTSCARPSCSRVKSSRVSANTSRPTSRRGERYPVAGCAKSWESVAHDERYKLPANGHVLGRLAQLGEHQLDKLGVTGSSPVPPTAKGPQSGPFLSVCSISRSVPVPGQCLRLPAAPGGWTILSPSVVTYEASFDRHRCCPADRHVHSIAAYCGHRPG